MEACCGQCVACGDECGPGFWLLRVFECMPGIRGGGVTGEMSPVPRCQLCSGLSSVSFLFLVFCVFLYVRMPGVQGGGATVAMSPVPRYVPCACLSSVCVCFLCCVRLYVYPRYSGRGRHCGNVTNSAVPDLPWSVFRVRLFLVPCVFVCVSVFVRCGLRSGQ